MLRLLAVAALLLAHLGCGPCPPSACTAWLKVDLRTEAWTLGTYLLDVEGGGQALRCTLGVPQVGAAPTVSDVECNDLVVRGGFVFDTGGTIDPTLAEVRGPFGDGSTRPDRVSVRVRHRTPAGDEVVLIEEEREVPWSARRASRGSCAVNCLTAVVGVELPPRP